MGPAGLSLMVTTTVMLERDAAAPPDAIAIARTSRSASIAACTSAVVALGSFSALPGGTVTSGIPVLGSIRASTCTALGEASPDIDLNVSRSTLSIAGCRIAETTAAAGMSEGSGRVTGTDRGAGVPEGLPVSDGLTEGVDDSEAELEGLDVPVREGVRVSVAVPEPDAPTVTEPVPVPLAVALTDPIGLAVNDDDADTDAEPLTLPDADTDAVLLLLRRMVRVPEGEAVPV